MNAAQLLTCRFCGSHIDRVDQRYVCVRCSAEMRLDEHGDEEWRQPEGGPGALKEVAA